MRRALDAIAARAADHLRREAVGAAVARSARRAMPLLPAGAALVLVLRLSGTPLGALLVLGLAALPFGLVVALDVVEALFTRVPRGAALGRVDAELGLHDRLRAADEFLGRAERSAFMEAAVADAAPHLDAGQGVALPDRGARPEPAGPWAPASAFLLVVAALLAGPGAPPGVPGRDGAPAPFEEAAARADEKPREREARAPEDRPRDPSAPPGAAELETVAERAGAGERTRKGSAAPGRTARTGGSGAQARSADAAGAPSAAGRASAQKLATKTGEPRPRKKKPSDNAPPPRTPPRRDSGATSGSARSSGSSRNPTVSEWKTRDTPPDDGAETDAEDEDVEDESETSETRGGVQPNLRSRKPPANRDLGIGFGNRATQRSNGRGGASPRKKSRGTASLVLGVPVPDHIKGQPNPGMTKVTRERGEPQPERAGPVDAEPRTPRAAPAGAVPRAEMPPWMQELIRRYFSKEEE